MLQFCCGVLLRINAAEHWNIFTNEFSKKKIGTCLENPCRPKDIWTQVLCLFASSLLPLLVTFGFLKQRSWRAVQWESSLLPSLDNNSVSLDEMQTATVQVKLPQVLSADSLPGEHHCEEWKAIGCCSSSKPARW